MKPKEECVLRVHTDMSRIPVAFAQNIIVNSASVREAKGISINSCVYILADHLLPNVNLVAFVGRNWYSSVRPMPHSFNSHSSHGILFAAISHTLHIYLFSHRLSEGVVRVVCTRRALGTFQAAHFSHVHWEFCNRLVCYVHCTLRRPWHNVITTRKQTIYILYLCTVYLPLVN